MVARMWEGLDAVDWAGLKHNYGSAEDVPGLLRRCAGPDPEDAEDAANDLLNTLFHQGGWICPAVPAALPFLLRLAAAPEVPSRRTLLDLVAMLASEAGQVAKRFVDPGWAPAWERALPEVFALLADPQPEIRRTAVDVVGLCDSPGELTLPALLRCWADEADEDHEGGEDHEDHKGEVDHEHHEGEGDHEDHEGDKGVEHAPATRLDLVIALGRAVLREPAGVHAAAAQRLLRDLLDGPEPQLRLAAAHGLAASDPDLPVRRLDLVLGAVRDPSAGLWQHTSSLESGVRGVHQWTGNLFTGPSPSYALGLLADHPDDEHRIGALEQAARLLCQWRSPVGELLPVIASRLDDPSGEVRFRAAELLACLGPSAAAHADAVAALLGDTAARKTRPEETVADAALWALARMNDPRCVPGIIERVTGARSAFPRTPSYGGSSDAFHHPDVFHYPSIPGVHEALVRFPGHAQQLLPAICDRLDTATDVSLLRQLCDVLAAWGPTAEASVPKLLRLLEGELTWAPAATALAGIGPAGRGARDVLLARSTPGAADAQLAAWAYWKVGGEPGPALELLGPAATEERFQNVALRRLADLGPQAIHYTDRLRTLVATTDWTSVEAAHALWAATGDTQITVPALLRAVHPLAEGRYLPVMLPAVRYLTRIGHAAHSAVQPTAHHLRDVPKRDQRFRRTAGWQAFADDETIRTAVDELLNVTTE